jgi:hypothetical protein
LVVPRFWIEFDDGRLFCVSEDFVCTVDGEHLIRYVSVNQSVVIGFDVEGIGHGCFCYHKQLNHYYL